MTLIWFDCLTCPTCTINRNILISDNYYKMHKGITVGVNKNCTLVFVNFSGQDASILKISVPIIKRRS